MQSIYSSILTTKSGSQIPVFHSGRTAESKYNPQLEAQRIVEGIEKKYDFFILIGVSSGILLKNLVQNFNNSVFFCIEPSENDYSFLFSSENNLEIRKFMNHKNIHFCTFDKIESQLCQIYLPVKFNDFKIIETRGWSNENKKIIPKIYEKIQNAANLISSDFSTQAHFGKLWINNILNNLKLLSSQKNRSNFTNQNKNLIPDLKKTAAVIAAGTTLDNTIQILQKKRDSFYIISTDTAYSSLIKHKIIPDVVISIDGQNVSYNHFLHNVDVSKTSFLFDLTSNYKASKYLFGKNSNIHFFAGGHPFSTLVQNFSDSFFPNLFAGAGTVTIAATDFAFKCGFENIQIFGADFSYQNGKSYTKGTYLDILYHKDETRIYNSEFLYDKLMFRSPLEHQNCKQDGSFTTKLLQSYKNSFESFIIQNKYSIKYENSIYYLTQKIQNTNKTDFITEFFKTQTFEYNNFINYIQKAAPENVETALLPLAAFFKINLKKNDFSEILKVAHSYIVEYNNRI